MESIDIRVCKLQVKIVTINVQTFIWFKHGVINVNPKRELSFVPVTPEFLDNLCLLVWIESYRNEYVWGSFLEKHFKRMKTTPYLFAKYFTYASYLLIEKATDVYACFCDILALITHFAFHCWQENEKKFIFICVDLFCAFFDKELCSKFEEEGSWKNFNRYLENQESLKRYKELMVANKPENEIFIEFQTRHLESKEPYIINGVVLKDITEFQVENDKKVESFADSVADKVKQAFGKNVYDEVNINFPKIDLQLEKLHQEIAGEACGGMASVEDPSSLHEVQEVASENVPSKTNPDKSKDLRNEVVTSDPSNIPVIISVRSQEKSPVPQESHTNPKSTKVERAKLLLEEMMKDIEKISELIKYVCDGNTN